MRTHANLLNGQLLAGQRSACTACTWAAGRWRWCSGQRCRLKQVQMSERALHLAYKECAELSMICANLLNDQALAGQRSQPADTSVHQYCRCLMCHQWRLEQGYYSERALHLAYKEHAELGTRTHASLLNGQLLASRRSVCTACTWAAGRWRWHLGQCCRLEQVQISE